ncbi:MAG TPA: HD domain-containing protein [Candidatus Binatia bacterium]|jgi:HD superfamily phosphohydrolase|nr:HD domain-containing protein [Candidatus Binatia bacterium]
MNALEMCRNVHDGIHGLIRLTKEEVAIIDHPLFQRLRWIAQTGLLKLICPTATHSRFEHSLGAVHMAQQMCDALFRESHVVDTKLYGLAEASPGQAVRIHEMDAPTRRDFQRVLRLCALVHDLGHGPLSHAFEAFAPAAADVAMFLDDPRLWPLRSAKAALRKTKTGRIEHEAVSCIMFAAIWHELGGEPWVPEAVATVLLGTDAAPAERPGDFDRLRPFMPLLRDMISSAPVDADRMDYLLRDSRATGVSYGLYEPHRVLKSILCVRDGKDAASYRLGWRKSGLRAIENFATARFQMYVQIYHHKTLRAIELMLHAMRNEAAAHGITLVRAGSLDEFLADYGDLSDESFLRGLRGHGNVRIAAVAGAILRRKLWKRVYEFEGAEPEAIDAFAAAMRERRPGRNFLVDRQPLKAMKDLERGALLLELDGDGKYARRRKELSWLEASSVIRALKEKEQSLVRLFMETGDEPGVARAVRKDALRLAAERSGDL